MPGTTEHAKAKAGALAHSLITLLSLRSRPLRPPLVTSSRALCAYRRRERRANHQSLLTSNDQVWLLDLYHHTFGNRVKHRQRIPIR
jgi:hypothetical protein